MRYTSALAELNRIGAHMEKEWDLKNIKRLLKMIGNPEKKLRIINVTGTNGKGSVTVMLASILRATGYSVGTYTSPHIDDFRERVAINTRMIPRPDFARIYSRLRPFFRKSRKPFSFFEITTAIALEYFAEKKVDFAVLEAGMGGRLDATNVGPQELLVITNVELDHTAMLGNTVAKIAEEKVGLLHGKFLLTGETKPEVLSVLRRICTEKGARLLEEHSPRICKLRLLGQHQFYNAGIAAKAARLVAPEVSEEAILRGLSEAFIPGRFEVVSHEPMIVMDGAHNPAAAKTLADVLRVIPRKRLVMVFGAMADKDVDGILQQLAPLADVLILNQPALPRALSLAQLVAMASKYTKNVMPEEKVKESLRLAKRIAGKEDVVLLTGSLYMLSEARGKNSMRITQ